MLEVLKPEEFSQVFQIMEESFPKDEYRTREGQKELLENPVYHIYVVRDSESRKIKAFTAVWDLKNVIFVEHLAVSSDFRNGGLGALILQELRRISSKPLCLEVELPETEMSRRRIGFYERNGFFLNRYDYMQPALSPGQQAIPLWIMTTDHAAEPSEFEGIRNLLYQKVYGVSV